MGEFNTYKNLMPLKGYKKFLFNVYLPKEDGETTELDVILLHESGIYVFESKNCSGWIFGSENWQYWTQTLLSGNRDFQKYHFFNPVIQNKVHLKWLYHFLGDSELPIYSYIVFSDNCVLQDITLTSGIHHVINSCDILDEVEENSYKAKIRLSHQEIDDLYEKIYPLTQIDKAEKSVHIENIQQKQEQEDLRCPYCGGRLVVRKSAKGRYKAEYFLGCSNYPKCRYTEEL